MIRINVPRFTAPTPAQMGVPTPTQMGVPQFQPRGGAPPQRKPMTIRRPPPRTSRPKITAPRLTGPVQGKVQNIINRVIGATPEDPIRIPVEFGQVQVKADKQIQNTVLVLGGLALVGTILYANR